MRRVVEPERLDHLPPADPQAGGSRADLRRLNAIMGHASILTRAIRHHLEHFRHRARPLRLVELGAGDGTLLLQLARRWSALGVKAHATLLDRHDLLTTETRRSFVSLGWTVEVVTADVFDWLAQKSVPVDVMLANLFLHHFPPDQLAALLPLAAAKTDLFLACEPRRARLALTASRLLWILGCNGVTRHDAVASVRAGFAGHELSALWPRDGWQLSEKPAGLFSHCFVAHQHA